MAAALEKLTEEQFRMLPEDGFKHELVNGEVVRAPTNILHDLINSRLNFLLYPIASGLGIVTCGQTGFRMANGNIRVPDVAFMRRERLGESALEGFGEGAPDLCVEVISPSERKLGILSKIEEYFASGAQQVWLLQPESASVTVYLSETNVRVLAADEELHGGDLLPGFRCRVGDLFPQ